MSVAIVQFCGSNCDRDTRYVYEHLLRAPCQSAWQDDLELPPATQAVVLPGGFSFGDYLRSGALAAHRPILKAVKAFAEAGGPVLGICNGFQILCEAHILPGALLPNQNDRFICKDLALTVTGGGIGALRSYAPNEAITLPIAHHDGRYYADDATLLKLEKQGLIALQYSERDAKGDGLWNGSRKSIAGIFGGPKRNVLGLMPHPERRSEMPLGGVDGLRILEALIT